MALCSQELREATASNADLCGLQDALRVCTVFEEEVERLDTTASKGWYCVSLAHQTDIAVCLCMVDQECVSCEAQTSASHQETTSERKRIFQEVYYLDYTVISYQLCCKISNGIWMLTICPQNNIDRTKIW